MCVCVCVCVCVRGGGLADKVNCAIHDANGCENGLAGVPAARSWVVQVVIFIFNRLLNQTVKFLQKQN